MAEDQKIVCVCGKEYIGKDPWCSPRCKWIIGKMDSPLGQRMPQFRAVRFFGRQWDKMHHDG